MYLLRPEAFGSILYNVSNGLFYTLNKKATHLFISYKNGSVQEQEFQLQIKSSNLDVSKNKLTILPSLPILKNALVSPMVAYLLVTSKCNLRCKHCFVSEALVNNPSMSEMSLNQIKSTVDELKKNNVLKIILTGGEVFLRPDIAFLGLGSRFCEFFNS